MGRGSQADGLHLHNRGRLQLGDDEGAPPRG